MATQRGSVFTGQFFDHPKHGPLPALLLLLTFGTGLVDAVSLLGLGAVFVANMTGNVVFIGFGIAGTPGYSVTGSLVALVGFVCGAALGGLAVSRSRAHRGRLLAWTVAVEFALFTVACVLVLVTGLGPFVRIVVIALAAVALGAQNAGVRALAVPDITTTVLTMTLTGIGADLRRGDLATAVRRVVSVLAMLGGAAVGALIVLHTSVPAALGAELAVLAVVLVVGLVTARGDRSWHTA